MKVGSYCLFSFASVLAFVAYAAYTREQFYPIVHFLVTSKVSYVIGGNMIFSLAFMSASILNTLFLGSLRESEIEMLADKAKYTMVEMCLVLTIFRNELTPTIIGIFGGLLFLNGFHWLAKGRIELLDQIMPSNIIVHLRYVAWYRVAVFQSSRVHQSASGVVMYFPA